jgi:TolA-binding protein
MTESDVLARAARALREAHTGGREGSGFTRARIMSSVHRERRGRTLRWAILSPIASVLVVGSAWAQNTGKWPVIWKAVTSVFVAAPAPSSPPASRSPSSEAAEPLRDSASLPPAEQPTSSPELAADAGDDEPPAPSVLEPADGDGAQLGVASEKSKRRAHEPRRRRLRPSPAPSSLEPEPSAPPREAPAEPERDRELGSFRRAHDLHFKGQASAAIDAYAEYLREYPDGRFVPEARYAMALDQIKLGNDTAARDALAPFAAGRYGGYRQKEARRLLRALDEKKKLPGR